MSRAPIIELKPFCTMEGPGFRFYFGISPCSSPCAFPCSQKKNATWLDPEECAYMLIPEDYLRRGGGVTLGGGILWHPAFARELLSLLKSRHYHTAIHTCGTYPPWQERELLSFLAYCDLVICDLPFATEEALQKHLGYSLTQPLSFLSLANGAGCEIWVHRTLYPGLNDDPEELLRLKRLVSPLEKLDSITLFPYQKDRISIPPFPHIPDTDEEDLAEKQLLLL